MTVGQARQLPTVHPHVCGEYVWELWQETQQDSVHPHVCGEYGYNKQGAQMNGRFIPTCVGNTQDDIRDIPDLTVHPHVCGEYIFIIFILLAMMSVHPHVCGEYANRDWSKLWGDGSSPRVWGILDYQYGLQYVLYGSSPRVWGIPFLLFVVGRLCSVHPHVCGEYDAEYTGSIHGATVHPHVCGEYACPVFAQF